jgi:hypothetical protein
MMKKKKEQNRSEQNKKEENNLGFTREGCLYTSHPLALHFYAFSVVVPPLLVFLSEFGPKSRLGGETAAELVNCFRRDRTFFSLNYVLLSSTSQCK